MRLRGAHAEASRSPPGTPTSEKPPRRITTRSASKHSSDSNASSTKGSIDTPQRVASSVIQGDGIDAARPVKYARTGSGRLSRESALQSPKAEMDSGNESKSQLDDEVVDVDQADADDEAKVVAMPESSPEKLPALAPDSSIEASNTVTASALPPRLQGKRPKGWHLRKENRHLRQAVMQGSPARSERQDSVETQDALRYEPGGLLKRLPGRRRAPHHDPSIEADMRRQLELKIAYRAVTKALKPVLTEIARRTQADLERDPGLHCQYDEFDAITEDLEKRFQERLAILEHEYQLHEARLNRRMEAEKEIIESTCQIGLDDIFNENLSRCQYDFMSTLRKSEQSLDDEATDDEDGIVPRLYTAQNLWNERLPLDSRHDSRSRVVLQTDRRWNELNTRLNWRELQKRAEPDSLIAAPKDVATFDVEKRALARAGVAMLTLLDAGRTIESNAMIEARKNSNAAAIGLQTLATAMEISQHPTKSESTSARQPMTPRTPVRTRKAVSGTSHPKESTPNGLVSTAKSLDSSKDVQHASPPYDSRRRSSLREQTEVQYMSGPPHREFQRGGDKSYQDMPSHAQAIPLPSMQLHRQIDNGAPQSSDQKPAPPHTYHRYAWESNRPHYVSMDSRNSSNALFAQQEQRGSALPHEQKQQPTQSYQPLQASQGLNESGKMRRPPSVKPDIEGPKEYLPHTARSSQYDSHKLPPTPTARYADRDYVSHDQNTTPNTAASKERHHLSEYRRSATLQHEEDMKSQPYGSQQVVSSDVPPRSYDFPPPPPRYMAYASSQHFKHEVSHSSKQGEDWAGQRASKPKRKRSGSSRQRSSTLPASTSSHAEPNAYYPQPQAYQTLRAAEQPDARDQPTRPAQYVIHQGPYPTEHQILSEHSDSARDPPAREDPRDRIPGHESTRYGNQFGIEASAMHDAPPRLPSMATATSAEEHGSRNQYAYETSDRSQQYAPFQKAAGDGRASPKRSESAQIQAPDLQMYRPPQLSILQPSAPMHHDGQALHQPVSNNERPRQESRLAPAYSSPTPIGRPIHHAYEKGAKIPLEMHPGQRIGHQILPATLAPIQVRHSPPGFVQSNVPSSYTAEGRPQAYGPHSGAPPGWPQRLEKSKIDVVNASHGYPQTFKPSGPPVAGPHANPSRTFSADGKSDSYESHYRNTPPRPPYHHERLPSSTSSASHTRTHSLSTSQTQAPTPLPSMRSHPSRQGSPHNELSYAQKWPGFDPPQRSGYPPHPVLQQQYSGPLQTQMIAPGPMLAPGPVNYQPIYPHIQIELPVVGAKKQRAGRKSRAKGGERVVGENDGRRRGRGRGRGAGSTGSTRGAAQVPVDSKALDAGSSAAGTEDVTQTQTQTQTQTVNSEAAGGKSTEEVREDKAGPEVGGAVESSGANEGNPKTE